MDWKLVTILVLISIMIGCAAGVVAHEVIEPEAAAQAPHAGQKWEHVCTYVESKQIAGFDAYAQYGKDGWEMVGIAVSGGHVGVDFELSTYNAYADSIVACFKRPVVA
ncbi:MAG: hypothetical protein JRG91_18585, partial [Deltaproteobacteria bacterium]|nr:hypothetical protein [Deltaproteobacteria bacterium]